MAAYVCLNCGELIRGDEDCCDKPDPFPVNDMPAEIKRLREQNTRWLPAAELATLVTAIAQLEAGDPAGALKMLLHRVAVLHRA